MTIGAIRSAIALGFFLSGCISMGQGEHSNHGVSNGVLLPCPASPNCVSSQNTEHFVEPLAYAETPEEARQDLITVLNRMKRVTIVEENAGYLRAEFRSALFRFVDDVEFYFNDSAKSIEVRSASRVGYSDFGVNRRRVEAIRKAWLAREQTRAAHQDRERSSR